MSLFRKPPPPPPTPEDAAAVERIRETMRVELLQLREIVDEHLERRGEVSAPEVRDIFIGRFRSCSRRAVDKVEKQRIMRLIRKALIERVTAGELRFKVQCPVESSGLLLRNYYERVRAPGRDET